MSYRARIGIAFVVASLLHIPGLLYAPALLRSAPLSLEEGDVPVIIMALRVPETDSPKQLIESGVEADAPSPDTDLISDRNTKAQDDSAVESDSNQPHVTEPGEFDQLATSPSQAPAALPAPSTPEAEENPTPSPEPATPETSSDAPNEPESDAPVLAAIEPEPVTPESSPEPEPEPAEESEPLPERFQVADAPPPAHKFVEELNTTRGRQTGGTRSKGIQSFEANEHEMGEYMLKVRRKVEKSWRRALQLKYTGTMRTYTILECSIKPDGELEYVRIVEPGPSMTYAAICRQSFLDAAPFEDFPFDVPSIYRDRNLVITWRLSFL